MLTSKYYKRNLTMYHEKYLLELNKTGAFNQKTLTMTHNLNNDNPYDETIISYILTIINSRKNIVCNITSTEGKIISNITSGKMGFKGSFKSKKFSMISILKKISYGYKFLKKKPILLKLKGLKYNNKLVIKKLTEILIIKSIINENNIPHNGCRPRKLKRK